MKQITYSIQDDNAVELATGYLADDPIPIDRETGQPIMSALEWIKQGGKEYFMAKYRRGKKKLAEQTAVIEKDLIE